jgi:hypothetical protein
MMARFRVIEGSRSWHCCFEVTVVDTDTDESICECFERSDAEKIADAMNSSVALVITEERK